METSTWSRGNDDMSFNKPSVRLILQSTVYILPYQSVPPFMWLEGPAEVFFFQSLNALLSAQTTWAREPSGQIPVVLSYIDLANSCHHLPLTECLQRVPICLKVTCSKILGLQIVFWVFEVQKTAKSWRCKMRSDGSWDVFWGPNTPSRCAICKDNRLVATVAYQKSGGNRFIFWINWTSHSALSAFSEVA